MTQHQPQQIGTPNPPPKRDRRPGDNPVFDWFFAIVDGIADTVKEMRDRGRDEANRAYDEGWQRFDDKTRYRRKRPGDPPKK